MTADARFYAEVEDGYLVATVRRERDYFSVTGEIHNSRRAYELGTGNPHTAGCIHDEILSAFPQLAPIVAMHLADVATGEPMHGPANGWYRLSGADMMHELDAISTPHRHRSYHKAPEPFPISDGVCSAIETLEMADCTFDLCPGPDAPRTPMATCSTCNALFDLREEVEQIAPEFVQFFVDMAARCLNCDADELSIWWDREDFDAFVSDILRPRWQMMADEANRLIDGMESTPDPSEETDCDEFSIELDAGLKISAKLSDDVGHLEGVGDHYQYAVKISAPGESGHRRSYATTFGGSVADYQDGRINAREAAFSTARELLTFEYETARGFIEESCGELWEELPADQRQAITRAEAAFDRMSDALIANRETLGG